MGKRLKKGRGPYGIATHPQNASGPMAAPEAAWTVCPQSELPQGEKADQAQKTPACATALPSYHNPPHSG